MPACIDALIESLTSEDESTRRFAVEDLGDIRDPQAIQPLFDMLDDDSAAVREAATDALSRIGGEQTVIAILPALRSDNAPLRNAACVVLERIGDPAIRPLAQLLADEDKDVRKFAVDVLAMIGSPSAGEAIVRAMQDTDTNVAVAAAEALGRIGCRGAVGAMAHSLKASTWMRCAVAKSLGRIGGGDAVRILTDLIGDTDDMVVFVAIQALGVVGDEASLQYMLHLFGHSNPMVVNAAAAATEAIIDRTNPDVWQDARNVIPREPIVRLTGHPNPAMRRSAVALLGRIGNAAVVGPLVVALASDQNRDHQEVREAAGKALLSLAPTDVSPLTETLSAASTSSEARCELVDLLGRLGKPQAFDAVAQMVRDEDVRVRRVSARCLSGLDPERAGAVLCRCLTDRDGHVRAYAARGLGSLLSRQALPQLIPLFEDPCDVVRQAAIWAVATIGGEEAIDGVKGLSALLDDPYPDVRQAATQALAVIGDATAMEVLVAACLSHGEDRQLPAIRALGSAPQSDQANEALGQLLLAGAPQVCVEALRSLSARGCQASEAQIATALQSQESGVRRAAVKLVAHQPGPGASARLIKLFEEDSDPRVRCECARGLGQLNAPEAVSVFTCFLQKASPDTIVAIAVIEALGRIGDPSASHTLDLWAGAEDTEIAEAARRAIEALGERVATVRA